MRCKTFLERLLDGVAVEWLPLGDLTRYEQPTRYLVTARNYSGEFVTPVLTAGKTFVLGYTDETDGIYKGSENPVVIFDDFTTANKWVDFDFKVKSSAMKMITSSDEDKTLLKYIFYWLNTVPSSFVDGDHKRQWIGTYTSKRVPIPCPDNPKKSLAIQAEIVRILDALTGLTAELTAALTAELTARKKQYNYYRDQFLGFARGDVEWKPLGEIGEFVRGKRFVKSDIVSNGVPCIHYGEIYTHFGISATETRSFLDATLASKLRVAHPGDVIIVAAGETIEDIGNGTAWLGPEDVVIHDACFAYKSALNPTYVSYFLRTQLFKDQIKKHISSGKISSIHSSGLGKAKILIPYPNNPDKSLEAQADIVRVLDTFTDLTTDLTTDLPREIELRRKHYDYYRDLLLQFPNPVPVGA